MTTVRRCGWLLVIVALLWSGWGAASVTNEPVRIILFIGDGMGEAHVTAARWAAVGPEGQLAMDTLPFRGWARTSNASGGVTDSAAGATALATGVKTNNAMVSLAPDGAHLATILEQAQARGLSVGLVTNTPLAHATPAAFAAHVSNRGQMSEIARQLLAAEVDVLLGGGENEFLPTDLVGQYPAPGSRQDGRNLIEEAIDGGYTYVWDAVGLSGLAAASTSRLLGVFADAGMTRPFAPTLAQMTEVALAVLSQNPQGFFLMVEGGQIDWAAHVNDAPWVIEDVLDFDAAVAVGLAYAERLGNTLVIVTADHETGGMALSLSDNGGQRFSMPDGTPFYVTWTTDAHTLLDVPVAAQGPWSSRLTGTHENTHLYETMYTALSNPVRLRLVSPLFIRPHTSITLTAHCEPVTATLPLTYTWSAAGYSTYTTPGGATSMAAFSWAEAGIHSVTVQALTPETSVTRTFSILVSERWHALYLPVIVRSR